MTDARRVFWGCVFWLLLAGLPASAQTQFPGIQLPPIVPTPPVQATDQALPGIPPPPPADATPDQTPPEDPLPGIGDLAFTGQEQADPRRDVVLENADSATFNPDDSITAKGHVRVRYRGYLLTSDQADINSAHTEATFSRNFTLKAPNGETVQGSPEGSLRLNLLRNAYSVSQAKTTITREAFRYGIIQPLFVYGGTITGRPGFIDARDSGFTTCDFLEPHYNFQAKQIYIVPEKHLVAKYVSFYRYGHRLFTIPYLYIPLDHRTSSIFPQFGRSQDEGYFVKLAIGYAIASSLPGLLRIDLLQKKGVGLGAEQSYGQPDRPRRGVGLVSFYNLPDRTTRSNSFTGSINHQQVIGTVQASLSTSVQQNSYFAGTGHTRSFSNVLNLTRSVGNLQTSLRTNLGLTDYGAGITQNLTSAFDQTFQPTNKERFQTRFNFSRYLSPAVSSNTSATDRQQLDSNFDYSQRGNKFDIETLVNAFTTIRNTTSQNFYGGLERLPEFRIATDSLRIGGFAKRLLPFAHTDFSIGEFHEPSSAVRTQRLRYNLDFGSTTLKLDRRNSFDYGGTFQQGYYGDNTAQYVLNGHAGYRLRIGGKSEFGASYIYLRPYGFTPLQLDTTGNTNVSYLTFNYQETRQFRATLATGYDFNNARLPAPLPRNPWQNLVVQTLFTPSKALRLRATGVYDFNHGLLLDQTDALRIRSGDLSLDMAARYAPQLHRVSNVTGTADLIFLRDPNPREDSHFRLRAIGGYNGFTDKFDYSGFALTKSWHDYEATLTYQNTPQGIRPGSSVMFTLRLKAFPATEPFAVGQFGQALDPGIGEVY